MNINEIKRPFQNKNKGSWLNSSTFYNTKYWGSVLRPEFRAGYTEWEGHQVSNKLCIMCFKEGHIKEGRVVDHIVAIKDEGSATDKANMQSLCDSHHNAKSAREGNERRRKQKL